MCAPPRAQTRSLTFDRDAVGLLDACALAALGALAQSFVARWIPCTRNILAACIKRLAAGEAARLAEPGLRGLRTRGCTRRGVSTRVNTRAGRRQQRRKDTAGVTPFTLFTPGLYRWGGRQRAPGAGAVGAVGAATAAGTSHELGKVVCDLRRDIFELVVCVCRGGGGGEMLSSAASFRKSGGASRPRGIEDEPALASTRASM